MANKKTAPTEEEIKAILLHSDHAVEEAILRLYARQTQDEKRSADAKHRNNRGFSGAHAKKGTKYATWILGMRQNNKALPGEALRDQKHKDAARKIALHYVKQLHEEAVTKFEAAAAKAAAPVAVVVEIDPEDLMVEDEKRFMELEQERDREDERRSQDYKIERDRRLREVPVLDPGTVVVCTTQRGYAALESDHVGAMVTVPDRQGIVMSGRRHSSGIAVNQVIFGSVTCWCFSRDLDKV